MSKDKKRERGNNAHSRLLLYPKRCKSLDEFLTSKPCSDFLQFFRNANYHCNSYVRSIYLINTYVLTLVRFIKKAKKANAKL